MEELFSLGNTRSESFRLAKFARCKYEAPSEPYVKVILNHNLNGERCAIQRYKETADFTNGIDHTTYQMATTILNEELEHEQDIEEWLIDIKQNERY